MNSEELQQIIAQENAGQVRIGVDRVLARRFFTNGSLAKIREHTGDAPTAEKAIVFSLWVTSFILLVGSVVVSFIAFAWWGLAAALICPIVYFSFASMSVLGHTGLVGISAVLVVALIAPIAGKLSVAAGLFIVLFVLSLWCIQFVYVASTSFYRVYALRSPKHYELLAPGIHIRSVN